MGEIISQKVRDDGKVVVEVCLDYEEALQLKGHMDKVHIFSEHISDIDTNMSQRGKNEATKYFLIPKQLRKELKFTENITCQKIEGDSRVFFIYSADKKKF